MFCDCPGIVHILTLKVRSRVYNQVKESRKASWEEKEQANKQTNQSITTISTRDLLIQLPGLIPEF
jgi:hypothetical protein